MADIVQTLGFAEQFQSQLTPVDGVNESLCIHQTPLGYYR